MTSSPNLFAACRIDGILIAYNIRLDQKTNREMVGLFRDQEKDFMRGVDEENRFVEGYTPSEDEVLTVSTPKEIKVFEDAITGNGTTLKDIVISDSKDLNRIKAIFTGWSTDSGGTKMLIQNFTTKQIVQKKWALMYDTGFKKLSHNVISFSNNLACIVEEGKVKFKSLHTLRSIMDMKDIYNDTTDKDVKDFAAHDILTVSDAEKFLEAADSQIRKKIGTIRERGVMDKISTEKAQEIARNKYGIEIAVENGKIVVPTERKEIKKLLSFLNDDFFKSDLTAETFQTNSKRPYWKKN